MFGLYSGEKGFAQYGNGDKVFSVQIIFYAEDYDGILQSNNESRELDFFYKNEIPNNLNPHQAPFILDWIHGVKLPVIK